MKISFYPLVLAVILILASCTKEQPELQEMQFELTEAKTSGSKIKGNTANSPIEVLSWVQSMQHPNGLLESAEYTDFVSLYDNSLAAILFIHTGEVDRAEDIFDYFNARLDTEFHAGNGGFFQSRRVSGHRSSRTWMGDNAWLLIALNYYEKQTGNATYSTMQQDIEDWLRQLQDPDGGIRGGYNDDGTPIHKVSEGILMAYHAVKGYDDFHKGILNFLEKERWQGETGDLVTGSDDPRYNYAMDLHPLGYLVLEDFPKSSLENLSRYYNTQESTMKGTEISGYCFDTDLDVVWIEGTAQVAVAYDNAGKRGKRNQILSEIEKNLLPGSYLPGSKGLPYSVNFGTTFGAAYLWEHADMSPALSSTIWYLFAELNLNPFGSDRKDLPLSDQFWIDSI
ncbi:hypothetical protein [Zeaxanthinibacter enoshimensis]|uniref:Uncharacterized protein n=1 Tax=Zeaxanthinibacter enoshimensis TaxID=392009 RepID=A0A4R6TLW3_9FLAO|nr:hypothetical protein [Zeaxanthinibacter enoshimensis]TDQ32384.1 hypothetical protein CLV82_0211 [Zeaxanthinibacter enoshimensis]